MEPEVAQPPVSVSGLLANYSLEALPKSVKPRSPVLSLPAGTQVYLPSIIGSDPRVTVEACRLLADAGLVPVPHLAARTIASHEDLDRRLSDLSAAGATAMMLIAGDAKDPAGPFTNTLDVLKTGALVDHGFRRLGVAGHPDGLAVAEPSEVERALDVKCEYAAATGTDMWITTQFVFAVDPIVDWMAWMRGKGINLPVRVGVAGPAKFHTVVAYAMRCGVGNSLRFLSSNAGTVRNLMGRWTPDDLVADIARHNQANPSHAVSGAHIYPFGGVAQTIDWLDKAA